MLRRADPEVQYNTNHVRAIKHVEGKEKVAKRKAREQDIANALRAHNTKKHLVGGTPP